MTRRATSSSLTTVSRTLAMPPQLVPLLLPLIVVNFVGIGLWHLQLLLALLAAAPAGCAARSAGVVVLPRRPAL